jgi:hypothetical protein
VNPARCRPDTNMTPTLSSSAMETPPFNAARTLSDTGKLIVMSEQPLHQRTHRSLSEQSWW